MLMLGGPLFGGLLVVFGASLAGIFLPMLGVTSPALLGVRLVSSSSLCPLLNLIYPFLPNDFLAHD